MLYAKVDGVLDTRVGYCGGTKKNPTYYTLGDHTETIQIHYDENKVFSVLKTFY